MTDNMAIGFGIGLIWFIWGHFICPAFGRLPRGPLDRMGARTVDQPRGGVLPVMSARPTRDDLEGCREDAALALVSLYRISRKAAIASLEQANWAGYPDTAAMVAAALAASRRTPAGD